MLKVTNKAVSPVEVFCGGARVPIAPGETLESEDFSAQEEQFVRNYPHAFTVVGSGSIEETGDAAELETLRKSRDTLADIVALFGSDEVDELNVKAAVEKLMQDLASQPAETTNDDAFESPLNTGEPLTLAAAVAALDDANDDHWTQAGLPDISTLKELTGGDVTRAQVDQLPDGDKRVRKV